MSNLAPWYVIIWRCLWVIPYHLVLLLLCLVGGVSHGLDSALKLWEEERWH